MSKFILSAALVLSAGAFFAVGGCQSNPKPTQNPAVFTPPPNAKPPNPRSKPWQVVPKRPGHGDWWVWPVDGKPGWYWLYDPDTGTWRWIKWPMSSSQESGGGFASSEELGVLFAAQACSPTVPPPADASAADLLKKANLSEPGDSLGPVGVMCGGEIDPVTFEGKLDVTIPMRSDSGFVPAEPYALCHEMYCVLGVDGGESYWTIRVIGDSLVVVGYLADCGFSQITLPSDFGSAVVEIGEGRKVFVNGNFAGYAPPTP